MEYLKLVVVVLHVASAALLFGAPLGLVRMNKAALEKGEEALRLSAGEAIRRGRLTQIGSLSTFLTGLGLIFSSGGFAVVPKNFHIAIVVMAVAMGFSALFMRPAVGKLAQASQKSPPDKELARAALAKLGMGGGILHLLWLINLTLMFFRF